MTEPDTPLLIIVTGPPGAGKTTVARALGRELELPVLEKDILKEALFDSLGAGDRAWSKRLGAAVFRLLMLVAERDLAAGRALILEANFVRGEAESDFAGLPRHRLVQVHCSAPGPLLVERYLVRRRHPGHLDREIVDEVRAAIRSGRHEPLNLDGTVIRLDTSEGVDAVALGALVRAAWIEST
jgi:predicted kinase